MNVAGEHIWGMRLGALSGLAMLVAVGCTGSVETSPVGGDADGSELELRNGGENTYTGTLDANGTSTRRRGIRIRSNGVLTLTLEWDNPSADLRLRLKQGRSVVADGTATEEAVQVIQRNVKSGEYYTAEVTARSGASSYALTVQLDKVGTPPPTTSCGD
ncbi:MAG: hypothetical protein KC417_07200, partial [Myxococcales bacterium]|nr:hypothetical protein [Myxococcales bacterium]